MLECAGNLSKCSKSFSLQEIPEALDSQGPKHYRESKHSIAGVNGGASVYASSGFDMYIPISQVIYHDHGTVVKALTSPESIS